MLNYMKSEWYRVFHEKSIYTFNGTCAAMILLLNIGNGIMRQVEENFPYGTTHFSFSILLGSENMLLFLAMLLGYIVFGEEYKHKTLKNSISFGLSRQKIFLGKVLVGVGVSFLSMAFLVLIYGGSGYLLLEVSEDLGIRELLIGLGAALPSALAGLILGISLSFLIENSTVMSIVACVILAGVPIACKFLGLQFEFFARIGNWMPFNFLSQGQVALSKYIPIWSTGEGLTKCILAGVIGIIVFYGIGNFLFRKREIH